MNEEDRVALVFGSLIAGALVIVLLGLGAMIYAILTADRKPAKRPVEKHPVEKRPVEGRPVEKRLEIEERDQLRARRIEMRRGRRRED